MTLVIPRGANILTVEDRKDGFNITVSGGGNLTEAEYTAISAYVSGKPNAVETLAKLRKRMERG